MAVLQSCFKNVFVINSLRKNAFQQSVRKKHLSFVVASLKSSSNYKKSLHFKNIHRYSSTGVIISEKTEAVSTFNNINVLNNTKTSTEPATPIAADNNVTIDEALLPPAPSIPVDTLNENVVSSVSGVLESGLTEPSLASLGLASWWPPGILQRLLEILHINFDLPWWGSIAIVTVTLRVLIFPLNVKARKNAVNMQNNLPQIQLLQLKINEARETGNYYDTARYMNELHTFIKEKKIATIGFMVPSLAQAPIFLSMFLGLKKMTALPVESMQTGGMLWFQDLTVADPYYLLPVIITGTLYLIIETGAEGSSVTSIRHPWLKYGLRAVPFIILPITINFSSAIQCYWVVSNFVALGQVLLFKIPFVKSSLKIPESIIHDPSSFPIKKKKGIQELKDSFTSMKVIRELEERERLNTITFEKAGSGPVPRTFKRDPLKVGASAKAPGK